MQLVVTRSSAWWMIASVMADGHSDELLLAALRGVTSEPSSSWSSATRA